MYKQMGDYPDLNRYIDCVSPRSPNAAIDPVYGSIDFNGSGPAQF